MPIAVACGCGKALRVKDEFAGRKVRCPECKGVVAVPQPEPAEGELDDEALNLLLTEEPSRAPRPLPRSEAIQREAPRPVAKLPPQLPEADKPKAKRERRSRDREERGYSRIVISPAIISGLLMMVGAAVWFFLGLALGWVYFYPPVMFVLGFITFVRGLFGHEE